MPNYSPTVLVPALLWLAPPPAGAQQPAAPPLITDRPDQTESAVVVPRGTVQLELGAVHAFDEHTPSSGERVVNLGTALLRVGVAPAFELRVGFAGWLRASADATPAVHGLGDVDLGAKLALRRGERAGPAIAVLGAVTLPTGHDAFGAAGPDPEVRLAVSHDLSGFGLGCNLGSAWTTVTDSTGGESLRTDLRYTAVLGRSLGARVGAFVEGFGSLAVSDGEPSWHALDAGLTLALRDNLQLDLAGGLGLTRAAEDWFVGAGVSVRVPR